jgi:hypothetical protein
MDWHADRNTPAQKLYPSKGRKGKMMTGKPGRGELMAAKQGKWVNTYKKWYLIRHKTEPTKAQIDELIMTGMLAKEAARLSGENFTVILEVEVERMDNGMKPADYLAISIANRKAEDEAKKMAEPANNCDEEARKMRLRFGCPMPRNVIHRLMTGAVKPADICDVFGLTAQQVESYMEGFAGVDMSG